MPVRDGYAPESAGETGAGPVQPEPDWVEWQPSPYQSGRQGARVRGIIYHFTAGPRLEGTMRWFRNNPHRVSAHYIIGKDARLVQMVSLQRAAHHAGVGSLPGCGRSVNRCTVGVEIVNWGPLRRRAGGFVTHSGQPYAGPPPVAASGGYWEPFTGAQYGALIRLTRFLMSRFPTITHITGHEDIAVPRGRKNDPGGAFDWARIRAALSPGFRGHIGRLAVSTGGRRELGSPYGESEVIEALGLGVAVFAEGRAIVTSGNLSSTANTVSYVHEQTPPDQAYQRTTMLFRISAHHPRYFIDRQQFWFQLSFEHNGNDLRNIAIQMLEDRSSRMVTSEFGIQFNGQPYSHPRDPVAEIVFQISGRWDPVGRGVDSFWGELLVRADGSARANINSEQGWVRFEEFKDIRRSPVPTPPSARRPPVPVPPPAPAPSLPAPVRPATPPVARPILRKGSRGAAVRDLQVRLNRWLASQGARPLLVDRVFGPAIEAAVRKFQSSTGLPVDGVVGPRTWSRLLAAR